MTANRKKQKRRYTVEELYNPQIDVSRQAYVYARQSGKDQVIENIQSHISQTIRLLEYTRITIGFSDDGETGTVTLFIENQVIDTEGNVTIKDASGTWSIDRRPGLKAICDGIESGIVGVVIAERVDRLFRDEDRIDSNVFIKICKEHDCFVHIESKRMTYNFANPQHAEMFRLEVQMAAAYIENHVKGTMLRRRSMAAQAGLWAGLGSVAVGYVVDKDKQSKTFGKFIIYEPHAEIVRQLFLRFIELGYSFSALYRQVRHEQFVFPPFEAGVFTRCLLSPCTNGYVIKSEDSLRNLLTNVTYIGTFKAEGVNRKKNHTAIIEESLFWSVYDHLKSYRPDGTPTGKLPIVRYTQGKSEEARPSLLKALIASPVIYSQSAHLMKYHYYELRKPGWEHEALLCVEAELFETIIVGRIFQQLRESNLVDLAESRKQRMKEKTKRLGSIEREVTTIAEENERLLENLAQMTIPAVVKQIEQKIQRLLARKEELLKEKDVIETSFAYTSLGTLEEELDGLEESWHERSFQLKLSLVKLLIKKICWTYESPRFYQLTVEWSYKEWGAETVIIDREHVGCKRWTQQDKDIIVQMYPQAEQFDILKKLPHKTWAGIAVEASKLHIKRLNRQSTIVYRDLSYCDI